MHGQKNIKFYNRYFNSQAKNEYIQAVIYLK